MLTRRDALRLATAAAAASAVPFAVSPTEAATLLDHPAALDQGPGRAGEPDLLDPVGFADILDGTDYQGLFASGAAEEMAAFQQTVDALYATVPALRDAPVDHPIHRLEEEALSMWGAAWMGGVRAGAAYEHLRLAMVTPAQLCPTCDGHGQLWAGKPSRPTGAASAAGEPCQRCGGAGTVPTPAPVRSSLLPA